jgi:hypothetical protein
MIADPKELPAWTVADEDPAKLTVTVEPRVEGDAELIHGAKYVVPGLYHMAGDAQRRAPLTLTDFAAAGADGQPVLVWLLRPSGPGLKPPPFPYESWSRVGNVEGSLIDGDPDTFRVTFDGTKRDEDWFAISRDTALSVRRVVFVQGRLFHDGGWWDTAGGKPRIEVQAEPDGPWRFAGALAGYPEATATDAKGLRQGQRFELVLAEPTRVVAVRVVGQPACGDSPNQAFASCAELVAEE